jgi:hypothetical protein
LSKSRWKIDSPPERDRRLRVLTTLGEKTREKEPKGRRKSKESGQSSEKDTEREKR